MAAWGYPGRQKRGQKNLQCAEPRWGRPAWKSLAWATQLLAALSAIFVVMIRSPVIGDAAWWLALGTTIVVLVLTSVLAAR
jgi:hypothetical protein